MKKILPVAIASLALSAVAADFSPSIGVSCIDMSSKNNLIPVQFTSLGEDGNISAGALVCTNNIPAGSHLYVYNTNGTYKAWLLEPSGWSPLSVEGTADGISYSGFSGDSDEQKLATGTAIWLSFPEKPSSGSPITIAVYGKVATSSTNTTIVAGTKANPVSTLVCNMTGTTKSVNSLLENVTCKTGDQIKLITDTYQGEYSYSENKETWKLFNN